MLQKLPLQPISFSLSLLFMRMREILISILLSSGMLLSTRARMIKVVEFQNDFESSEYETQDNRQPTKSTRQISLCFRVMPRYYRLYRLINTEQFAINLNGAKISTFFTNPANSSTKAGYWRFFPLCQGPTLPGMWTTMCLGMSFTQTTQLVRVFQDGTMCSERIYTGDFDLLYFPVGNSIETM